MKINVRLLLITFIIVALVSISYSVIYVTLTNKILRSQQINALKLSNSSIYYSLQSYISNLEDEIRLQLVKQNKSDITDIGIDYLFEFNDKNELVSKVYNDSLAQPQSISSLPEFEKKYLSSIIFKVEYSNHTYYCGKLINSEILSQFTVDPGINISMIVNGNPLIMSDPDINSTLISKLKNVYQSLNNNSELEYLWGESNQTEILTTITKQNIGLVNSNNIDFLIYSTSKEIIEFNKTMRLIMVIIVLAGILLTIILVLLFTTRIRKQINLLSHAAEITGRGNFEHKVSVISTDEIGKLGEAFNNMIDELKRRKEIERKYLNFISLINKKPTVKEIAETAIKKIVDTTNFSLGIIYLNNKDELELITSYGIESNLVTPTQNINFYKTVISDKKKLEFSFSDNFPKVKTGLAEISIEYLLVMPIIFNDKVIGILELASDDKAQIVNQSFIELIQEQLAIGLTNASTFEQLEELVSKLRTLNSSYQIQNEQVRLQNEQLKDLHDKLQEKADELQLEKEKAVELTKVKSQFLANMSHELRTPLNSILGLTELILKNSSTVAPTKEKLNIVLRNGKRLLILINNILEFSKIESDKFKIRINQFKLSELIAKTSDYIEPLAQEKELEFDIVIDRKQDYILNTSEEMLEQILINLLGNALKFTNKGRIGIRINVVNSTLEIEVIDTGIGISENDQKIIFDEFKQVDQKFKGGGAGLGLAICKKYVNLLKGDISVESKIKVGSKFKVIIPDIVKEPISTVTNYTKLHDKNVALIISENNTFTNLYREYLSSKEIATKTSNHLDIDQTSNYFNFFILDLELIRNQLLQSIYKIRQNPNFDNCPIFISSLGFKNNNGYMLYPTDYKIVPETEPELIRIISLSGKLNKSKIQNIAVLSNSELPQIKNSQIQINRISFDTIDEMHNYDLLLLDLINEHFNGIDILCRLRKNNSTKHLPIILLIDRQMVDSFDEDIYQTIIQVRDKYKYFPIDTLNIIRKRLNLTVNENLLESLIVSDSQIINPTIKVAKIEKTVLVVDDDKDTLFTVGEIIKEIGCKVELAADGVQCMELLEKIKPDLVLLDIMMPKKDGFETIKEIRENPKLENLKVVALTAFAMLDNKEIIEKNGFDDIITKPIIVSSITQKVNEYLEEN